MSATSVFILITFLLDDVRLLLGETGSWSLSCLEKIRLCMFTWRFVYAIIYQCYCLLCFQHFNFFFNHFFSFLLCFHLHMVFLSSSCYFHSVISSSLTNTLKLFSCGFRFQYNSDIILSKSDTYQLGWLFSRNYLKFEWSHCLTRILTIYSMTLCCLFVLIRANFNVISCK